MENKINENEMQDREENNEEVTNQDIDSNLDAVKEEIDNQEQEEKNDTQNDDKELKSLKSELEDYKNRFMRLSADFKNYKKRVEKEKNDIYKFGSEKIVIDILPIIDNFERAVESSQSNEEANGLLDGIQMILKQLIDVLKKHGVEEIDAINQEFDPNLHHAVMQEECEGIDNNIVTQVLQKGYMLNSKVIRPSMVKVAK